MSDWEAVKARLEDLLNVLETGHAVIEVGNAPDIRAAIQRVSELEARLDASFDAMVKRDAEYTNLQVENERLRMVLHRIEDLAHDGQSRDAAHAFGRLETIESKAKGALRREGEK